MHAFTHSPPHVTTFRDIFRDDATTRRTDAAPRYDPNEFVALAFAPTWAAMDFTRRFAASTLMIRMTKFRSREGESADSPTGRAGSKTTTTTTRDGRVSLAREIP